MMKFTISKSVFVDGLRQVSNVVSTKAALPILSNVKIEAKDGLVHFTGTDLDVCVTGAVPANVIEPGGVTLPAKRLLSIVNELPDAEIRVEVNDKDQASVTCGKSHFKLNGLPVDEFPELPSFENASVYTLDQAVLGECIRRTEYAISTDTTRYVLNGISLSFRDAKITLVATDGRRLALAEAKLDTPADTALDAILPTKAVTELRRLLTTGTVTVRFTRNQALFEINDTCLITKLIDGNYPNYRQVIPTSCKESIQLPAGDLLNTVRRVSLLSADKGTNVKLTFADNELTLFSGNESVGEAEDALPIDYTGTPVSIAFNPDFFMAPLRTMSADTQLTLDLIDSTSPGVIRLGDEFLYVIMPLRSPN